MAKSTFNDSVIISDRRIVAIGIGSSGKKIIDYMIHENRFGIELIIADFDDDNIYKNLQNYLHGTDVIFIVTGLGGSRGTVAAPIIAKIAKQIGALTIGIAGTPFLFEGRKRVHFANEALKTLKKECDSVVMISNDKLLSIIDPKAKIKESFSVIDSIFSRVIHGIVGVIIPSGENDINLDLADLQTIMDHRGIAIIGIGEHQGENAAYEAINNALKFAMGNDFYIKKASGVLVHFSMHPDFYYLNLSSAMEVLHKSVNETADVIYGTTTDESFPLDFIRVTVIATGVEKLEMMAANNVY